MSKRTRHSTRSVHGGEERIKFAKSLTNPISLTSTFVFEDLPEYEAFKAGEKVRFEYGRYGNPTQQVAERKLAVLDGGEEALLFPSGMSAVTGVLLAMLQSGQHMLVVEDCYRMTQRFCQFMKKFGVESSLVEPGDFAVIEAAVQPNTRVIFVESPTNIHLRVLDMEKVVAFARKHQLKVVVDSTFASPVNQRPLEFGVDLVVHSATKYLGGHNDLLAGSVCGPGQLIDAIREYRNIAGSVPAPHGCYLLIRGLKTLALRVERQNDSATQIARYLEEHPKVKSVYYPGLESHPDYELARAQMSGFGGVVSFEIDGDKERTQRFVHGLQIPYLGPSFGGVEALVTNPAIVSYYDLDREERIALGVTDQLVRYSAGVEETEELIEDIGQALERI